jgi:hypothetical protein
MNTQIELTQLWAKMDAKTGRQVLSGKFGFNARIRIEELAEPSEIGATHIVYILPPFVKRDDDGGQNSGYRSQGTGTPPQRQQSAPARQQSPEQPARRPARAPGFPMNS